MLGPRLNAPRDISTHYLSKQVSSPFSSLDGMAEMGEWLSTKGPCFPSVVHSVGLEEAVQPGDYKSQVPLHLGGST